MMSELPWEIAGEETALAISRASAFGSELAVVTSQWNSPAASCGWGEGEAAMPPTRQLWHAEGSTMEVW